MKQKFYSLNTWKRRFGYAIQGLMAALEREHSVQVHFVATILVIVASLLKGVTKMEAIALILTTAMVWISELINTAVERLADMITTDPHPAIKIIKDISAAAVLLSACAAVITGLLIFIPG